MSGATITLPGPTLDVLAQGLRDLMFDGPAWIITHGKPGIEKVWMKTVAGDELTFLRAPEMVWT